MAVANAVSRKFITYSKELVGKLKVGEFRQCLRNKEILSDINKDTVKFAFNKTDKLSWGRRTWELTLFALRKFFRWMGNVFKSKKGTIFVEIFS